MAKHSREKTVTVFSLNHKSFPTNYGQLSIGNIHKSTQYKHATMKVFQQITIFHSKCESFPPQMFCHIRYLYIILCDSSFLLIIRNWKIHHLVQYWIIPSLKEDGKLEWQLHKHKMTCTHIRYDYYLVSQHVTQGTVTPTHYMVVHDGTSLKPDHMQRYQLNNTAYHVVFTVLLLFNTD